MIRTETVCTCNFFRIKNISTILKKKLWRVSLNLEFVLHAVPLIPEILHYGDECEEGACNYGGGGGGWRVSLGEDGINSIYKPSRILSSSLSRSKFPILDHPLHEQDTYQQQKMPASGR
jgi:hypothetical protein